MSENLTQQDIYEGIRKIISDVFKVPESAVDENSRISDLGFVESIKLLRMAGKIERRFDVELENEALFRTASLREVADEIAKLRQPRKALH